jgi:hypothetical protein
MKRIGKVENEFLSYENFDLAERLARKGKSNKEIRKFDKMYDTEEKRKAAIDAIIESVRNGTFVSTLPITRERQVGNKVRKISVVPFYPDRILQFAIYNIVKVRLKKTLIYHVYSYDKGIHSMSEDIQKTIRNWDKDKPIYILKIDIKKFYESIDYLILLTQLKKYIKDKKLYAIIDEMLNVHQGVKIGMLLSVLFSSIYLACFDHFVKEELRVKHYFRFADDLLFIHEDKKFLHEVSWRVKNYLWYNLKLTTNYSSVSNLDKQPVNYCGYVFYRTHTLIRKETKKKFVRKRKNRRSVTSYLGMLKYCNSRNLIYKILEENNYAKKCSNQ